MTHLYIPTREQVSAADQVIFDKLSNFLGFIPNVYAMMAGSPTALRDYLRLHEARSLFSKREKEVISLVVSKTNEAAYCVMQHTMISKLNSFTDAQIDEMLTGEAAFEPKLDALARLTRALVITRGKAPREFLSAFFDEGYNFGHVVDLMLIIGDVTITNYLCNLTDPPIDF